MTDARAAARKKQPDRRIRRTPDQARQLILDTAELIISDRPFSELRIDDLMRKAGMTRTAFYHYFNDLGDVAGGVLQRMEEDLLSLGTRWLKWRAAEPPPREFLYDYFLQVANFAARRGKALASIYHASVMHREVGRLWDEVFLIPFFESVWTLVKKHIKSGVVSLDAPEDVIRALLRMNVVVILERSTKVPPDPPERIAETVTEIWYRTVYGSAAPARRSKR
jgi:AcrR family transcriptional regulator